MSRKETIKKFLQSDDTYSTVIATIMIDNYGPEWLNWEQETINMELEDDFGIKSEGYLRDKMQAVSLLLTTNQFYMDFQSFVIICNVFSGTPATWSTFDPATVDECAWGVIEAAFLDAPEKGKFSDQFSEEPKIYVGERLDAEGWGRTPPILSFAIRRKDVEEAAVSTFSDDPVMFNAFWDKNEQEIKELDAMVRERMSELYRQLQQVPLLNGSLQQLQQSKFNKVFSQP